MRFVIKNRLLKFRHELRRRPTLTSSLRKVLNRLESNFLGLEILIKGTVFKILRRIGQELFEKKLREEIKFIQCQMMFQKCTFELETLSHSIVNFTVIKARRES